MLHPLLRRAGLAAVAILMTVPSMARPAECQRRLALLAPDAPEALKLDALLTCAGQTRDDLAALGARLSTLERIVETDQRLSAEPEPLRDRMAEVERTLGQQGRVLEGLEAQVARAVTAALQAVTRDLAHQGRTLDGLDDRITRVVTGEMRELARVLAQHERALGGLDARLDRTVATAVRAVETALGAEIGAVRAALEDVSGIGGAEGAEVARLARRLDALSGRRWEAFGAAQRAVGQARVNDRPYPILVSATFDGGAGAACHARLTVSGVVVAETRTDGADRACFVAGTVPPDARYVIDADPADPAGDARPALSSWAELR
jgi:uncharacterized coiled-coil protein SlyX